MSEEISDKFKDIMANREKVEKRYTPQAKAQFAKPANYCQFCGKEMRETDDPMKNRWQNRWSIHFECANAVDNRLDRQVGILTERRQQ